MLNKNIRKTLIALMINSFCQDCKFFASKVIAAEGEQKASRALKEAADVIQESPSALQVNLNDLGSFPESEWEALHEKSLEYF